jgi:hypothetical protein
MAMAVVAKPFDTLKNGEVQGRVYRLLAEEPIPVYDSLAPKSPVMVRLRPGSLVVAFSDPGELRQINTADQQFGYISRSVKMVPVEGLDPEGLYDPEKRAEVEAKLPPVEGMLPAQAKAQTKQKRNQFLFMMGFVAVIVFGFLFVVLKPPPDPAEKASQKQESQAKTAKDFMPPEKQK